MHARMFVFFATLTVGSLCVLRSAHGVEPDVKEDASGTTADTTGAAHGARDELTGYVSAEGRWFFQDPLFPDQEENNASLAAQPEYYHQWKNGSIFTFTPFGRVDSADSERTHWDIRELYYLYPKDWWTFRAGVARVFWGSTEFVHLVDVVNQTDLVEHIDGEEKLGQPLIQFTASRAWGTLDIIILPYFRERTYPGSDGRLRPELMVDTDHPFYESTAEENAKDIVLRYSRTLGDLDFGVYFFKGTNRDPVLVPADYLDPNDTGDPRLIPFYDRVDQFGVDAQWVTGNWLWKFEGLYKSGYLDPFFAATGGVEYTFFGLGGGKTDVGLLAEYAYDHRGDAPEMTSIYDNDAFFGVRLSPNDMASTLVLVGVMQDLDDSENALIVEASRRFGSHWRLSLDAWLFCSVPEDSVIYDLRDDSFLRMELAYHF
ncbi:MAG: hypothetical protein ABFE13_14075 [Phycisphaerales bacterium]